MKPVSSPTVLQPPALARGGAVRAVVLRQYTERRAALSRERRRRHAFVHETEPTVVAPAPDLTLADEPTAADGRSLER